MTLREMIEQASHVSEQAFAKYGEINMHWLVVTRKDERRLIPRPPGINNKSMVAEIIRRVLADLDAVQVVFVDEAWQILAEDDAQMAEINKWYETHDSLEDFPGRCKVVMFTGEDESGRLISAQREIIRRRGGAILGPLKINEVKATEGRLTGWLGGRGTKH